MKKLAVVSACGAKSERSMLAYRGDHALRVVKLIDDVMKAHRGMDAILLTGVSYYQMKHVTKYMTKIGYKTVVAPDFLHEKDKWRFTQLTIAFVLDKHNKFSQLRYDEDGLKTKYRYVAFKLDGDEIRLIHVPCVDKNRPHYEEQIQRKESMLRFEMKLEEEEIAQNKRVLSCGDYNTEIGGLECHEIFDALPYKKMLDEPTWHLSKIDNILVSPALEGKVKVFTEDFEVGRLTDHKTVVIELGCCS